MNGNPKIEMRPIDSITPYPNNPRHNQSAIRDVATSIRKYGFKQPIVVDKEGVIVVGHTRYEAAKELGLETVPVLVSELSDKENREYRIADNKTNELASWDFEKLAQEMADLDFGDFEFDTSFLDEIDEALNGEDDEELKFNEAHKNAEDLYDRYIYPPFSVLDARNGKWQNRKATWHTILKSGEGREDSLLGNGLKQLAMNSTKNTTLNGTSIFDPVLAEILVAWFSPKGGKVIDPFAGGSVRGIVSAMLGRRYYGNDLRQEQIDANEENWKLLDGQRDFYGATMTAPVWTVGDSTEIDRIIKERDFDMLMTCPPYADLEKYSDDPRDISNMDYTEFVRCYREIIRRSCAMLKTNAFAAIVVGEVRDKEGNYRNFVGDTIKAFEDCGLHWYNNMVLLNAVATAALRAARQFDGGRKVVTCHQHVLVFIKGDAKKAMSNMERYELTEEVIQMLENPEETSE